MKAMRIGVDIDGTVADLVTPLLRRINDKYNQQMCYDDVVEYTPSWWWLPNGYLPELLEILESDAVLDVEPMPDCRWVINRLMRSGHTVDFVTARSGSRCKNSTRAWLEAVFGNKHGVYFIDHDKGQTKGDLGLDMLIDDCTDYMRDFVERNPRGWGVIIDQPWNRNFPTKIDRVETLWRVDRCYSWKHLNDMMVQKGILDG